MLMRFVLFYLLLISSILAITPAEFNTAVKEGIDKVDILPFFVDLIKDLRKRGYPIKLVIEELQLVDKVEFTNFEGSKFSGTSMAAPQITGHAASLLQKDITLTAEELKSAIIKEAKRSVRFFGESKGGRYFVGE